MNADLSTIAGHQLTIFTIGYVLCLMTPGPNFLAICGVALARGFRGSLPVSLGIAVGSMALAMVVATAAEAIPDGQAWERTSRAAGALLLGYVAWRLMKAASPKLKPQVGTAEFTFGFATAFVNPITGAYFASQFLVAPAGASGIDDAVGIAIVPLVALVRSLLIAALLGNPSVRARRWIAAPELGPVSV
jgi:threonine/homoserine/homoserine lactone efflux protein